jgi:hypothetical protein
MNWQARPQAFGSELREIPQSVHRSRFGAAPTRGAQIASAPFEPIVTMTPCIPSGKSGITR